MHTGILLLCKKNLKKYKMNLSEKKELLCSILALLLYSDVWSQRRTYRLCICSDAQGPGIKGNPASVSINNCLHCLRADIIIVTRRWQHQTTMLPYTGTKTQPVSWAGSIIRSTADQWRRQNKEEDSNLWLSSIPLCYQEKLLLSDTSAVPWLLLQLDLRDQCLSMFAIYYLTSYCSGDFVHCIMGEGYVYSTS